MHSPVLPFPMGRCGPIGKCTQGSNVSSTSLRPIHQLVEQEKVVAPVPGYSSRPKEGEWKLKPKEGYVSHVRACARPHGHEGVPCRATYQTPADRTAIIWSKAMKSTKSSIVRWQFARRSFSRVATQRLTTSVQSTQVPRRTRDSAQT